MRVLLAATALLVSLAAVPAAADDDSNVTFVFDRTGQAVVTLPDLPVELDLVAPRTGVASYAIEQLDARPDAPVPFSIGMATRIDGTAHRGRLTSPSSGGHLPAGRYLVSATVTGSAARLTFLAPDLDRDLVVRVGATRGPKGAALARVLTEDSASTATDLLRYRLTRQAVPRVWGQALLVTGTRTGLRQLCLAPRGRGCVPTQTTAAVPGETSGSYYPPGTLPAAPLDVAAQVTGAGRGGTYVIASIVAAPLPR